MLDDSNRPIRIVHMNVLHVIYSVKVIEIVDVKVVYAPECINQSRHYGMCLFASKISENTFLGGIFALA